jgi:hypothetical protein
MKNKKFTYFLGFLVLVVWGGIIYRILDTVSEDENVVVPKHRKENKQPYNDYSMVKHTAHLSLNYRDPFKLARRKETAETITNKRVVSATTPVKSRPDFSWGFIKYSGYIRNPGSKNLVAVVSINNKSVMMSEGETVDQVKLIKNMRDSIKVAFAGKTSFIKM